jgi:citrate lyase beta subunit
VKSIKFGATMYMPASRPDLAEVGNGLKLPNLRTVVFCTEDSVDRADLPLALSNLRRTLPSLAPAPVHRLIRPRDPEVLAEILAMPHIGRVAGFVIPKADRHTLPAYLRLLESRPEFGIMPTLETKAVFDLHEMYRLRDLLAHSPLTPRIPVLRIGSLDLLSILSLRRDVARVVYDTPVAHAIDQLVTVFRPAGLELAAPGFEGLGRPDVLAEELGQDVARGLFAKTCVHPDQIDPIHEAYKVRAEELEMAEAVLDPARPAVFRLGARMCEKAVHAAWAAVVLERARYFGSVFEPALDRPPAISPAAPGPRA